MEIFGYLFSNKFNSIMMPIKIHNYLLVLFLSFSVNLVFSQVLTKSTEYNDKKKRRDLYYDENLNLIKEDYYTSDQKIVNQIQYDKKGNLTRFISLDKYGKVKLDVDYILGTYIYPENKIELKFKGDYIFDGIQKGDKFIISYTNGKKNGVFLQTDSAVVGSKSVTVQKVDPRFLKFNILKYYVDSESESVYKLFNGVRLNFKNNVLEGSQSSYYSNGNVKFKSRYHEGIIYEHEYFDETGNVISKVISENGILKKPILKNGILKKFDNSTSLINVTLNEVGDIKRNFLKHHDKKILTDGEGNLIYFEKFFRQYAVVELVPGSDKIKRVLNSSKLKTIFDEKKFFVDSEDDVLSTIFSIPIFELNRFNFNNEENLISIPVVSSDDSIVINKLFTRYNDFNKFYDEGYGRFLFTLQYINNNTIGEGPQKAYASISDQKAYLSNFIKKVLCNVSEFENNSKKYVDPFESSLFGQSYNYKNFNVATTIWRYDSLGNRIYDSIGNIKILSDDSSSYLIIKDKQELVFCDNHKKYTFFSSEDQNGGYKIDHILLNENGLDYLFSPADRFSSVNDSLIVYKDTLLSENYVPARLTDTTSNWLKIVTGKDERKLSFANGIARSELFRAPVGDYKVSISFMLDKFGRGLNVKALDDPGYGTKNKAMKLIYNSPPWTPAKINGKNVNSIVKIDIIFPWNGL